MPLADLILSQITQAGYRVCVHRPETGDHDSYIVRADHPAGQSWQATAATLVEAAAHVAASAGLDHPPVAPPSHPADQPPSIPAAPTIPRAVPCAMTAAVFLLDLLTPGLNIGVLYLIPLGLTHQSRLKTRSLLALAGIMIALIYADSLADLWFAPDAHLEPLGILNRGFAVAAIAACAAIMSFRRARGATRHWIDGIRNSTRRAAPARAAHVRRLAWLTFALIAATFTLDLFTPVAINLPILYLIPLALIALLQKHLGLWRIVVLLLTLMTLGYYIAPRGTLDLIDTRLIAENRLLTGLALALIAVVFQVSRRYLAIVPPKI